MKSHVRIYMNEGHDIVAPKDLKEAMESHNGVPRARVTLVEELNENQSDSFSVKWEGISTLNNFLYTTEGIRCWQGFGIGKGKLILWKRFDGKYTMQNI
jgi:hypothetical protein